MTTNYSKTLVAVKLSEEEIVDIISSITQILSLGHVRDIDFMPTFDPPYILFQEGVLGISMKIIKPLYLYIYRSFMKLIQELRANDKVAPSALFERSEHRVSDIDNISKIMLTLKGDFPLAYSYRKKLLLNNSNMLAAEMQFIAAIFSKHPKSPSGWEHRRWCLKLRHSLQGRGEAAPANNNSFKSNQNHSIKLNAMELETERELCSQSAEKYPKNYYAWMHRLWLIQFMSDAQVVDLI